MTQVTVTIKGANRVRNQLRTIAVFHPEISDPIIREHAKQEQRELRRTPYPPKPPLSTYKRKRFFGGIAGSFSAIRKQLGVWLVTNSRLYAEFVIGEKQAWMHQGRWWKMADESQKRMPILTKNLSIELEKKLDGARD